MSERKVAQGSCSTKPACRPVVVVWFDWRGNKKKKKAEEEEVDCLRRLLERGNELALIQRLEVRLAGASNASSLSYKSKLARPPARNPLTACADDLPCLQQAYRLLAGWLAGGRPAR